jgi:hypothetical protein
MVHICQDCGQIFLSRTEFNNHVQTHYQTHLDKWSDKDKTAKEKAPDGLNRDLYKVFERYNLGLGEKAMLCLWRNGQLNTTIREPSRILELQDRLKEWL